MCVWLVTKFIFRVWSSTIWNSLTHLFLPRRLALFPLITMHHLIYTLSFISISSAFSFTNLLSHFTALSYTTNKVDLQIHLHRALFLKKSCTAASSIIYDNIHDYWFHNESYALWLYLCICIYYWCLFISSPCASHVHFRFLFALFKYII